MPIKRTYAELGDACFAARALEVLGDRWSYPIMRELALGTKRFGELQRDVVGVTPAVLSTRLTELEGHGLIRRIVAHRSQSAVGYELTAAALELQEVWFTLGRWGRRHLPDAPDGAGLTPDAVVQAMLTVADHRPLTPSVRLQLHLSDTRTDSSECDYVLHWDRDGLTIGRGTSADVEAVVHSDSSAWAGAVLGGLGIVDVSVDGDAEAVERVAAAFADG
jgi:DNA-binding HxlR family transcriptional regulator